MLSHLGAPSVVGKVYFTLVVWGLWPGSHCFATGSVHLHTMFIQELCWPFVKLIFLYIDIETIIQELREDMIDMVQMLFLGMRKSEYIINIDYYKVIEALSWDHTLGHLPGTFTKP